MKRFFLTTFSALFLLISPVMAYAPKLVLGGESVGIVIRYAGVYVSGTYTFQTEEGNYNPLEHSDIQVGDIIVKASGKPVRSMEDLFTIMQAELKSTVAISVSIVRNNQQLERQLKLRYSETSKTFKTGLYVKDSISGVGTISFYNPLNHTYGALGHDIMNTQSGRSAEIGSGNLYLTRIVSIRKSSKGNPGEKVADTSAFQLIGTVLKNTIYGVYGTYQTLPSTANISMDMAMQQEVQLGMATIRTVLKDNTVEEFQIEITKLNHQPTKDVKGIQFRIVDEHLLQATGGIVQGMSGSPIIQNGKIIGAITHVLVQKPDQGYGIFIEWMVEEANHAVLE